MSPTPIPYVYHAQCVGVHDGDTIAVNLQLGFDIARANLSLRLNGLNADELNTPTGKQARDWLSGKILGKWLIIQTFKDKQEKFGRILVEVWDGEEHINAALIASGHAQPWDGRGARPVSNTLTLTATP